MLSRRFLIRLLLAVLGILLIGIGGVAGLGWLVFRSSHPLQAKFYELIGDDRWGRLHFAYARISGAFLPADSDGDVFPDVLERYMGVLSDDPTMYPDTFFYFEGSGFTAGDFDRRRSPCLSILLEPGERRRVCVQLRLEDDPMQPAWFARNLRMALNVDPQNSLNTSESSAAMTPDGRMRFDLTVSREVAPDGAWRETGVGVGRPGAEEGISFIGFHVATRRPPLPLQSR